MGVKDYVGESIIEEGLKKIITIFLFIVTLATYAQEKSTLSSKIDSLLIKIEKVKAPALSLPDTLKTSFSQATSIKSKTQTKYDSTVNLLNKPQEELNRYTGKIDSMQNRITKKIDSLSNLTNPNHLLIKGLDSLRGQLDSLKQTGIGKSATDAVGKVNQAQTKVTEKVSAIENKINEKLGLFNSSGGNAGSVNLPSVPGLNNGNPIGQLNTNLNLPENPLGNSLDIDHKLPGVGLNQLDGIKDVANVPKKKLGEFANMDGIKEVKGKMGEVSKVSTEINAYSKDARNLAQGNIGDVEQLPKTLETKAADLADVNSLQKEFAPVADYTEMLKKWNSDPDVAKELALNKAKDVAVNHFVGHEQDVKVAMDKLSKVKTKYKDADGVIDMFKKHQNTLKDKPFIERLLPGIGIQIQKKQSIWVDFNPYVGYKISNRFVGGLGWNERVSFNTKQKSFIHQDRIYGARSFVQFKLKEGFLLRGEAEIMNAYVLPYLLVNTDPASRQWVWSYFGGIKRDFKFSKFLMGNVQVMYNLYNPEHRSPYVSRLNIRMGFEFPCLSGRQ